MPMNEEDLEYTLKDFRYHLSQIVGAVNHGRKRVRVTSYGKTAGYFVSEEEIAYMEALEDQLDQAAIERAIQQGTTQKRVTWDQVKADNDLS